MVGGKGIVVELFAGFGVGDGYFAPIDQQGILAAPEGDILNKTTGDDFGEPSVEMSRGQFINVVAGGQGAAPFIQDFVAIRLADKDEVELLVQEQLAQRLIAVQIIAQQRHLTRLELISLTFDPPFSRHPFAVLLPGSILRGDVLRGQANHL